MQPHTDMLSHPTGVRGLKFIGGVKTSGLKVSHPTGVRGLKYIQVLDGAVSSTVAPHWGAWIEIRIPQVAEGTRPSHPTGVRGLKYVRKRPCVPHLASHPTGVRGLKSFLFAGCADADKSHPTGVRGLKYTVYPIG